MKSKQKSLIERRQDILQKLDSIEKFTHLPVITYQCLQCKQLCKTKKKNIPKIFIETDLFQFKSTIVSVCCSYFVKKMSVCPCYKTILKVIK